MRCQSCKKDDCCCKKKNVGPTGPTGPAGKIPGFPIWMIDEPSDLQQFDFSTGLGSGEWTGWAICDGQTHNGVGTPNLTDRFVVGAGNLYNVGDTGGEATHVLSIAELPAHTHVVNDPQHTHVITVSAGGDHTHTVNQTDIARSGLAGAHPGVEAANYGYGSITMSASGTHVHAAAATAAATGITNQSTGSGTAHNNLPPYFSLCFIKKIF